MDKLLNNSNDVYLKKVLNQNIELFKQYFSGDESIIYKEFESKGPLTISFCAIYVDATIDKKLLNQFILAPLMECDIKSILDQGKKNYQNLSDLVVRRVVTSSDITVSKNLQFLIDKMLFGHTIILVDGCEDAIVASTKGFKTRAIGEPEAEKVIKGPRDGFNESLEINLSLIRKKIRTPKLKFNFMEIGNITKTKICVCYIQDIASEKILKNLLNRIKTINIGETFYAQSIDEYIKDSPLTLFDTIGNTERPDVFCAKLSEGRIGILVDGTPFALTLPFLFNEYFQSPDDYTNNYIFSSFNRVLRLICFFMGISVPALFTAVTTFHQELIPTPLLLSIAMAREGLPFPTLIEAIAMMFGFDLLREAGVRLPKPVGQTVSIVGALVLGEAAVNARIVSAPMVIMIAVTGIASFAVPKMLAAFTILRLLFLVMSGFVGLYGYTFCMIGLLVYLASLRSFGVPYMLYSIPTDPEDIKDTLVRAPWYMMTNRLKFSGKNYIRKGGVHTKNK